MVESRDISPTQKRRHQITEHLKENIGDKEEEGRTEKKKKNMSFHDLGIGCLEGCRHAFYQMRAFLHTKKTSGSSCTKLAQPIHDLIKQRYDVAFFSKHI